MNKLIPIFAVLAALGSAPAVAAESTTLQGEVLDMACYLGHDGQGAKHAKCAKQCVKTGAPVGLLGKDGSVTLLVPSHGKDKALDAAKELAGEQAKVTGKPAKKAGISALLVEKVEKAEN